LYINPGSVVFQFIFSSLLTCRKRHDYAQYGRFDHPFDAFHEFFGDGGGFRFKFQNGNADGGQRIYHKQSITSKAYWNNILPNRLAGK
jgi:hypothetical protein